MKKYIQITQDAACVLHKQPDIISGVYTNGIQSCIVIVIETGESIIVIHDSAQLSLQQIERLIKNYGSIVKITIVNGDDVLNLHIDRLKILYNNLDISEEKIFKIISPVTPFSLVYDIENGLSFYNDTDIPGGVEEIPLLNKRQSIVELNNYFIPPNSQSLKLDVQYINGKYSKINSLNYSIGKILKIIRKQPDFFFTNMYFLFRGHRNVVCKIPNKHLKIIKKYNISEFSEQPNTLEDIQLQKQAYEEFIN